MEHEEHMDKMARMSEMIESICATMDEMKSIMNDMMGGSKMTEDEYLKSPPEKRESYDKMKMMGREEGRLGK